MALSNFECMAFGYDGKPCNGVFNSFGGTNLEIYKNFLYISNKKMWNKECEFQKPTIAKMTSGYLMIGDMEIFATRGSILDAVFVNSAKYGDEKTKTKIQYKYFAGIGCSGYDDNLDRLCKAMNVDMNKYKEIDKYWCIVGGKSYYCLDCKSKSGTKIKTFGLEETDENKWLDSQYVGVTKELFAEFMVWLERTVNEEIYTKEVQVWLSKVKKTKALKFNQGDAFFDDAVKCGLSVTEVGKIETPLAMKMMGKK